MDLHLFPIPIPPHTSLSTRSLWVFPVHQVQALVSCIQPGLVICFTLESPFDCKEVKPVRPKGINPEYSLEGLMLNLKVQYFGHLM